MTVEQAVLQLRRDPAMAALLRDSYIDPDPLTCARAFHASEEFAGVARLLGAALPGAAVLDLGSGTGVAAYAFARAGASWVCALEPDPSAVVGYGAIRTACAGLPVQVASGYGEALPFAGGSFDVVYARQVLHHALDLAGLLRECARVLKPGGTFLACREHVVDDDDQLRRFLAGHPIHQLCGGENAHPLPRYLGAVRGAGLEIVEVLGPYDSIINAFPNVPTAEALAGYSAKRLSRRLGALGAWLARFEAVDRWVRRRHSRSPGRLYAVLARRPAA
jgi:SAM-dependent methyltransferase